MYVQFTFQAKLVGCLDWGVVVERVVACMSSRWEAVRHDSTLEIQLVNIGVEP
jgi:hypothetical protein